MTDILNQGLQQRQAKVKTAKEYLARTRQLFNEFGSDQLKTTLSHFNGLADALNADEVRLVVLGEFSRGKSSLVNALLGINLLPTAMEATTAINTFIRALPAGRTDRHIKVHYQNGTPDQEIPWLDDKALVSWGTELDAGHADVRKTLDYIEVFMDHPLLQKGLVLIDTPGLESVMEHHEMITRRAIAESHIALWVQNTTQLGGSASEWDFLEETLRTNFSKFITVVGWWDKVLEPEDSQDLQKSETQREEEKLERIRANFRKHLSDAREIASLTGPEHLIPVSAKWAMTTDPEKQRRSNVNRLAERITNMFTSGEAMEQIYSKPLQQMTHIQNQLSTTLADELQQLASDKT
ncbi:MAG: dynamin family protein, partial [Methylococcaceae bacterium]